MVLWLAPALPSGVPTAPPVNEPKRFVNENVLLYVAPIVAGSIVHEDGVMSTPRTVPVMLNVAGPAADVRDTSAETSHTPAIGFETVNDCEPPVWNAGVSIGRPCGENRQIRIRPFTPVTSTLNAGVFAATLKKKVAMSGRSAEPACVTGKLTAVPRGSVIEPALENVPSLPTHVRLYAIGPLPPVVRVNVIVRVPVWPAAQPSRS